MLPASRAATAVAAAALTLGAGAPALAGDPPSVDQWKMGQTAAGISWVEEDRADVTGRPGNVHIGGLLVLHVAGSSMLSAGSHADWDCPPGAMPWEDEGRACSLVTQYEASADQVRLELDGAAGTARVTGNVTFSDIAGVPDVWSAPVDLTWTTEGSPVRSRTHVVELSSTFRFVSHERVTTWPTVRAGGTVGTIVLGDEPGELNEEVLWYGDQRVLVWERPSG